MKCPICKHGETATGTATLTMERNGAVLVVKGVPAQICNNCGEEYIDEEIAAKLLHEADECAREGTQVNIRNFRAA